MAGITNSELDAIHKQINDFPDIHSELTDHLTTPHKDARSGSGNQDERLGHPDENDVHDSDKITQLQEEIASVQEAIAKQQQQNQLLKAWQQYQGRSLTEGEKCDDVTHAKIESLKHKVETAQQLNSVSITKTKTQMVKQGKLWLTKKKYVEGNCGEVEFQLKMEIQESMNLDTTVNSRITHLSISASESLYKDLKETVEILATQGNAQGFLTMLRPYNMWRTARDKTFKHFTSKFPEIASLHNHQVLHLTHPVKKCTFIIEWTFKVTDIHTVVPDLQLTVQVPNKVSPPSDILTTAPDTFQLMLKQLGIEKTIHSLVLLHLE